jgi:hypothetical protein
MMSNDFKKFLFLSFLFLGLFFLLSQNRALAQECTPGEKRSCNDCGTQTCQSDGTWGSCVGSGKPCCTSDGYYKSSNTVCDSQYRTQYKCEPNNQCGNKILKRIQEKDRYCPGNSDECTGNWGDWYTISSSETQCQEWQVCKNGDWTETELKCECAGQCLKEPKNPRYYDNPEYPTDPFNPEKGKDPNNVFLPVKLDWDDVKGWKGGWKENGEIKNCSEGCVQSYVIRFEKTAKNSYSTTVDKSEYNYREDPNAGACFLKSGDNINWHVKACCNSDGTNCGPESNFQFKTNSAPEPIEPYDKDWNGPKKVENLTAEEIEKLKWCETDNSSLYKETILGGKSYYRPLSYKLLIYYSENDFCHPILLKDDKCHELILKASEAKGELFPPPEFWDENHTFFTRLVPYAWKVAPCIDDGAAQCMDYSQLWRFEANFTLEKPTPLSPPNDTKTPIGLPVLLQWTAPYAASSRYKIFDESGKIMKHGRIREFNLLLDYPLLSLDRVYGWQIQPCYSYEWTNESKNCENVWSEPYWFRTTGRPPSWLSEKEKIDGKISIPAILEWENVPGAKSYRIKIWGGGLNLEKPVNEAKFYLDYPDLKQERVYSWQVKTCAKENGEVCGEWSETKSFKTFILSAPSNPSPRDNEEIFTYQMPKVFSWNLIPYARYYEYTIDYVEKSPEEKSECPTGKVIDKIVSNTSDLVSLNCLGKYQWQVRACLDKDCQEAGDWSNLWNFTLSQKVPPGGGGLVPCGRDYDDPRTLWNEREPCQIKHLFLLLRNILDFLFWRIGLIILVLLVIITGIIYYLSVFSPEILGEWAAIANIRSIWKYAGIGYGIIFLAWLIINLFLALVGYKFQIFGRWWEIKF